MLQYKPVDTLSCLVHIPQQPQYELQLCLPKFVYQRSLEGLTARETEAQNLAGNNLLLNLAALPPFLHRVLLPAKLE